MFVYPLTFYAADGKTVIGTGEMVSDVSLPVKQFINLVPAANGTQYSGFPAGNPPAPIWSAVPNFLNETSSVSINVLTTYLTPTTGVTCVLNGTLPTGWSFNGTTLAYNGTSINSSPTTGLTLTATVTATGISATSNAFSVQGQGTPVSDTTAPTIPLNVAVSVGQTTAVVSWNQSCDVNVPGHTPSNLGNYLINVKKAGTDIAGSPFSKAPGGTGTLPVWTVFDVGTQTSSIVQTGADLAISTTAIDPAYPTTSAIGGAGFQLTSTGWIFSGEIDAFASGNAFDNLRLEVRASNATNAPYVAILVTPSAGASPLVQSEYRAAAGGSAAKLVTVNSPGLPIRLFISWNAASNTFTFAYSNSGNAPISLGSIVQAMGNTLTLCAAGNASVAGTITGTIKQVCVQVLPPLSLNLTGLTAATLYTVTVKAQDQIPNVSTAGAAVNFTTSSASGGGGGGATSNGVFPQIAIQAISGSQLYPPGNDTALAQYGLIILGGNYPSWPAAGGRTRDNLVGSLKTQTHTGKNALIPLVFQYEDANELNPSSPWWPEWLTAVTNNNWFVYASGSSGTKTQGAFSSSYVVVNWAHLVGADSATELFPGQLVASLLYQRYYLGTGSGGAAMASQRLDGYFLDDMPQRLLAGSGADWQRNDTNPSQYDPTATGLENAGKGDYPVQLATLNPAIIAGANGEWGFDCASNAHGGAGMATPTGQSGKLGLCMQQFVWATGTTFGNVLNNQGFANAMAWYQIVEANTKSGGIAVITGGVLATDYQLVRYSLGLTLMRNGWALYAIDSGGNDVVDPSNLSTYPVFDEFWGGSLNTAGYLGAAVDAEQTAAIVQGCWVRNFANGRVIVNPAGNGSQTIALGGTFYRLRGTQVPSINTGAAVTSVTIAAGDTAFLLRSQPP